LSPSKRSNTLAGLRSRARDVATALIKSQKTPQLVGIHVQNESGKKSNFALDFRNVMNEMDWDQVKHALENDNALHKLRKSTLIIVDLSAETNCDGFDSYLYSRFEKALQHSMLKKDVQHQAMGLLERMETVDAFLIDWNYSHPTIPLLVLWDGIDNLADLELKDSNWPLLHDERLYEFRKVISNTLAMNSVFSLASYTNGGNVFQAFMKESLFMTSTHIKSICIPIH
jgi:hypothetical protein